MIRLIASPSSGCSDSDALPSNDLPGACVVADGHERSPTRMHSNADGCALHLRLVCESGEVFIRIAVKRTKSACETRRRVDYGAGGATGAAACPPVFTRSFNSLLGLKKGIFLAGTSTRSPVFGLRPTRGLR